MCRIQFLMHLNRLYTSVRSCQIIFSTALNLLLLARGFSSSSFSEGTMGFRVMLFTEGLFPQTHTGKSFGHVQPFSKDAKVVFTILSSNE